mgnify:CR=1 FL=1
MTEEEVAPGLDGELVVFEVPGLGEPVVEVHAWHEGAAAIKVIPRNGQTVSQVLEDGETFEAPGAAIRLEQVLSAASTVSAEVSPYYEAVLERDGRRYRLREGEQVRIGDARVQFYYEGDAE